VLMRPAVTFRPTMPHQPAGSRTEPPVSVPMAIGARPAATATAEPLDEPPGVRWTARSHGFRGVPMWVLVPQLPIANSTVWVLPSTIIPAAIARSARVAVTGETRSAQTFEPPVVTRPSRSTRSLSAMGTPWSGPTRWPERIARSAPSAAWRASSAYTAMKECNSGSRRSMRSSRAFTASTGERVRAPKACDSSATPAHTGSILVMSVAPIRACPRRCAPL
jgi:hypothetical protein